MRRFLGRFALGAMVVVLVVAGSAIAAVALVTHRALPQVSGRVAIAGLAAPVEVIRDVNGVVHITADSPHDLFLAQGYVHAQERLWQMELWRHISYGRLSELFGESQLRTDRLIRTLGWRGAAERDLAAVPDDVRAALEAYAAGVNAYLDTHGDSLGLPFVVAGLRSGDGLGGYRPEPWTPLDSMTWAKVQAWSLSGNFESEVFRLLADARLGDPVMTDQLLPEPPPDSPVIVPAADGAPAAAAPASRPAAAGLDLDLGASARAALLDLLAAASGPSLAAGLDADGGMGAGHGVGSNNWVVAPSRSASGHALLANDPHLAIMMPSIWFMNGLHCRAVTVECPFDVAGVSFPGVPAVVLGHNARIAWGATNANPDVQDLYVETVDPADPGRYLVEGESRPFETREERIRVAGGVNEVLTVRSTGHGPVLNDVDRRLRDLPQVLALRWPAIEAVDRTVEAIFRVNTAASWEDFRAAMSIYGGPSQNFVYADVDGHIGYQLPGAIPVRPAGDLGDRPVSGSDGAHEWSGLVPFEDLPSRFDPPEGLIVTANNAITDPAAGGPFLGREVDPGYRAQRALDLLSAAAEDGDGITLDEMAAAQTDTAVLRAPLVIAGFERAEPRTGDGRLLLDRIRAWDGTCPVGSQGCAAYMALEYRLLRDVFDARLGLDLARDYVGTTMSWQALIALLDAPVDPWWDDPATAAKETAPGVISASLDRAAAELRDAFGAPSRWTWGRLHTATFEEQSLGTSGIGPLEWYLNVGPYPAPGAAGALNAAYYRFRRAYPDPADPDYRPVAFREVFHVTNLPSLRHVVDLGRLDEARIVITTGNAGNPFDRHYGDLVDDWLAGRTIPLWFGREAIQAAAVSTLTMEPAGQ